MKVEFEKPDRQQKALRETQMEMRRKPPRRLRVLAILASLAVIAILGYLGYHFFTRNTIYTYGLVSGDSQEITAPTRAIVAEMNVRRGDFVEKGEVIAVLTPETQSSLLYSSIERLRKARETLKNLIRQRDELTEAQDETKPVTLTPEVEDLERRLQEKMSAIKLKRASRDHGITQTQLERDRKAKLLARQQQRVAAVEQQVTLGTAVNADLERVQDVQNALEFELEQAEKRLAFLKGADKIASQEEDKEIALLTEQRDAARKRIELMRESLRSKSRQEVNALKRQIELMESEVEAAEQELSKIRERFSGREIKALFDGIVTEAYAPQGATLDAGQSLVRITSVDDVWVDAYIPPAKAFLLKNKTDIKIYTELAVEPLEGELTQREQGAIVRPPPLLRDLLPGVKTAKYARLTVKNTESLKPGNIVRIVMR